MLARTDVIDTMVALAEEEKLSLSKLEAGRMFKLVTDAIIKMVAEDVTPDQPLYIYGLGTFRKSYRKATTRRNPKTGETFKVAAKYALTFKATRSLKSEEAE